eukprot:gene14632-14756_t
MAELPNIDIQGRSAVQLATLINSGLVSAEDIAERTLGAIAACDDPAIFTRVTAGRALTEARAANRRVRAGRPASALDGVPVAWKDLFALKGMATTAGAKILENGPSATEDATVVARLKSAGMICVGRVNMSEFAFSGLGLNPHYGTPRNACVRTEHYAPGGSSSGSAVAVARGLVPVAIGSDTGGSVRIPAAFNGIIGFKASTGRYPMDGVYPLSNTLDTLGIFSRTVEDAMLVDAAMCGQTFVTMRKASLKGVRILVPTNVVLDGCDPAVLDNFEASLARLALEGAVIERGPLPVFDEILALSARHGTIVAAEAYALHKERVEGEAASGMDRRVVKRIRAAASIALVDYIAAMQARTRLIAATNELLAGGCLVAMPSVAHTAPLVGPLEADDEVFASVNLKTLRNTMMGNYLGWCGVSVPNGTDAAGLPTGFLLSGAPDTDERLLAVSLAAEAVIRPDES